MSERGRGEEGRLRDRKQRLEFFGDNLRNITNGNFQLFTRHSSARSARSRLCFTAGVSAINEGIKQIPIDLFYPSGEYPGTAFAKGYERMAANMYRVGGKECFPFLRHPPQRDCSLRQQGG